MPKTIKLSDITVTDRQRSDLGDLDADFASVKEIGLIQPIILEERGKAFHLVAGGRRLTWLSRNGFETLHHGITCDPKRPGFVLSTEMTDLARDEAELYENIKRQSLNWREECMAIARIHRKRWAINKADAVAWSQVHTGRLLGIKDKAKVGYALQIADELRTNPDSPMAKLENYVAAVRYLNEQSEAEARKEQDRRRALVPTTPELPLEQNGEATVATPPPEPTTRVRIHLSQMVYHGDFNTIAEDSLAPDMFPVAFIPSPDNGWMAQVHRLLKQNAVVIWLHGTLRQVLIPPFFRPLGHPVIWNILDLEPDPEMPFLHNQFYITILLKGSPLFPNPAPTSIVSASAVNGVYVPNAVTEFLLHAVSLSGDSVLMPKGGPVGTIAKLGRRPVAFTDDELCAQSYRRVLREHYNELYNNAVDFVE